MKRLPALCALILLVAFAPGCRTPWEPHPRDRAPMMRTEQLGQSVMGRPIFLHRFGEGPVGTLIMAGIHGDETTTMPLAENFMKLLQSGEVSDFEGAIAVIPVANPDGAAANKRRNARNVDVNRNFPAANWGKSRKGAFYGGPAALSEPETVAIHKAVTGLRPRQIISIHSITRGRQCNNYDGPAEDLARRMARHNGYPAVATIGYPTPGSFGSWAGIDLRIPVVTLELPRDLPADQAWAGNREALIEAVRRTNAPPMPNDEGMTNLK